MDPHPHAGPDRLLAEPDGVLPGQHRLGHAESRQPGRLLRRRIGQNQNRLHNARVADLHRLVQIGHAEPGGPRLLQRPGHIARSMPVGIRLHHRHGPAARRQRRLDHPEIMADGVQINLRPGSFEKIAHIVGKPFFISSSFIGAV